MWFLATCEQTLEMYEITRVQRRRKNIWTPHVIRSLMVFSFCPLDLPQPSYGIIKTLQDFYEYVFCTKFYNGFILKISACAITPGFCKSGHILFSPIFPLIRVAAFDRSQTDMMWDIFVNKEAAQIVTY